MTIDPAHAVAVVEKWKRRLGLSDWTCAVGVYQTESEAPEDSRDAEAYVEHQPEVRHFVVGFNAWQIDDEDDLNAAACHEVVHVVTWMWRRALKKIMPRRMATVLDEQAVDQIATALAALDPQDSKVSEK